MSFLDAVMWLALNVYHEARGEDFMGQVAVVHVTLNRRDQWGMSIEEVIRQPSQFSWTLNDRYFPTDWDAFVSCIEVVEKAMQMPDPTYGATHYHAIGVSPYWASTGELVASWGDHVFYRGVQ